MLGHAFSAKPSSLHAVSNICKRAVNSPLANIINEYLLYIVGYITLHVSSTFIAFIAKGQYSLFDI